MRAGRRAGKERGQRHRHVRPLPEAAGRAAAEPGPAEPDGQRAGHEPDGADQHRQRHREARHHGAEPLEPVRSHAGTARRGAGRARRGHRRQQARHRRRRGARAASNCRARPTRSRSRSSTARSKSSTPWTWRAQPAGMGSFSWPAGKYDNTSGLTFRVSASLGKETVTASTLMQDKVTAGQHEEQRPGARARPHRQRRVQPGQGAQLSLAPQSFPTPPPRNTP